MRSARAVGALLLGAALSAAVLVQGAAAEAPGDAARGQHVFTSRQCARCHLPRGQRGMGPALEEVRRPQGAYELTGRLWNHAPAMFTALKQEGVGWPQIGAAEMADLMAFLGADPKRDPSPDLARGQVALVSKGCLKCHSFRKKAAASAPTSPRGTRAGGDVGGDGVGAHAPHGGCGDPGGRALPALLSCRTSSATRGGVTRIPLAATAPPSGAIPPGSSPARATKA